MPFEERGPLPVSHSDIGRDDRIIISIVGIQTAVLTIRRRKQSRTIRLVLKISETARAIYGILSLGFGALQTKGIRVEKEAMLQFES
jgi:hypothetical protein